MQKTKHFPTQFAVAMSLDHGTIVFLRDGKPIGSMPREQSVDFCQKLIDWRPPEDSVAGAVKAEVERPKLSIVN